MTRFKAFLTVLSAVFVVVLALSLKFYFDSKSVVPGSLQVNSIPKADVILDGKVVGQTPYLAEKIIPGEHTLRLGSWDQKVKILPGALTYVSQEDAAKQVLTLEKIPAGNFAELAVVCEPDGATVTIDGLEKGKTSAVFKGLTPGDRVIAVTAQGYADQVIFGRLVAGYRLNAVVKLRQININQIRQIKSTEELLATPSAQIASSSATVKDSPLGYVWIRQAPEYTAQPLGKVYPGEKYPVLLQSDDWVEIRWQNKEGWVAKDYLLIM